MPLRSNRTPLQVGEQQPYAFDAPALLHQQILISILGESNNTQIVTPLWFSKAVQANSL
jgi:hypothetical protein